MLPKGTVPFGMIFEKKVQSQTPDLFSQNKNHLTLFPKKSYQTEPSPLVAFSKTITFVAENKALWKTGENACTQ